MDYWKEEQDRLVNEFKKAMEEKECHICNKEMIKNSKTKNINWYLCHIDCFIKI